MANTSYIYQFVPTHPVSDPPGLQKMLEYLKNAYQNPPIYVQENGRFIFTVPKYKQSSFTEINHSVLISATF